MFVSFLQTFFPNFLRFPSLVEDVSHRSQAFLERHLAPSFLVVSIHLCESSCKSFIMCSKCSFECCRTQELFAHLFSILEKVFCQLQPKRGHFNAALPDASRELNVLENRELLQSSHGPPVLQECSQCALVLSRRTTS